MSTPTPGRTRAGSLPVARRGATLLALLVVAPASAAAQEPPPPADAAPVASAARPRAPLSTITVAASRGPRLDLDVPSSATVLTGEEARLRTPARTLPELLQRVPGVWGQETSPAQGSPLVRGLTGFHVLTLVDGVRLNGSFFRQGPNNYNALVDPLTVRDVEVVRGPGSVLYGSDALGGVIAVRTRVPRPPDGLAPGEAWFRTRGYFRLLQPLRRGGEAATLPRLELEGGRGPVSALGGFDYGSVGDREAGRHQRTLRETGTTEVHGDLKVVYDLGPDDRLTVAATRTEQRNAPRTHSTVFGEPYRGTVAGTDLRRDLDDSRQLVYAQLESRGRGPLDRLTASVSAQRIYEQVEQTRPGRATRSGFEAWTLGTFVQAERDLPLPLEPTLSCGVDYGHDVVDSFETDRGRRRPRGPIADDADYDLLGAYVRLEVHLERWLDVYAGARYTLAHVTARDVDPDPADEVPIGRLDETYDAVVGAGGLVLHFTEHLSLVGSVGQGFRAPNLDDTSAFRAVSSRSFDTPNPDLDPERSLTLEAGLKVQHPCVRGQLFYATTFLRDQIRRVPTGRSIDGRLESRNENFARGAVQAVDGEAWLVVDALLRPLELDLPATGLSLGARFSWVRGAQDELIGGERHRDHLRRGPPARLGATLRWEEPDSGWLWAEVEADVVREQRRVSQADLEDDQRIPPRGSPGYTLWHVRAGVTLLEGRVTGSVGLVNVFDREHRLHGSGSNGLGRALVLAIEAGF